MSIETTVDQVFNDIEKNLKEKYWDALDVLHAEVRERMIELKLDDSYGNKVVGCAMYYIDEILKQEIEADDREAVVRIKLTINSMYLLEEAS